MTPIPLALSLVTAEIAAARAKHGESIERGSDDRRLRITMAELGEVAEAIEDLEKPTDLVECDKRIDGYLCSSVEHGSDGCCDYYNKYGSHSSKAAARAALLAEVVQVAACAMRWVEALAGEEGK